MVDRPFTHTDYALYFRYSIVMIKFIAAKTRIPALHHAVRVSPYTQYLDTISGQQILFYPIYF